MAAPASSSPLAPIPPDWPHSGSNDVLRTLFLQCVDGYIAEAGNDVDWPLVARASAAMRLRSRRREPREWIRFLLRSRATHGEFHQLVRDMRLDDGSDFFRYFRMTRQRFDHLLSLVGPLLQKKATFFREPISPAERLSFTIRQPIQASEETLEAVVWACVNLHNYLRVCDESEQGHRRYCPQNYADHETPLGGVVSGGWRADVDDGTALSDVGCISSTAPGDRAKAVRDAFSRYFCSLTGEVPWQYSVVFRGSAPNA
ncbi:hypothetical protein HPB47_002401 [Ixodes persulcatus]|uniref:Uncharacterized protein n=1 Tax=Ixodes persulcatus TaxID=34615 RepID=A0AC60PMW4_IXOPE|nr:hypothetical protein HPB47_002401 [Ixodes persulcatus]